MSRITRSVAVIAGWYSTSHSVATQVKRQVYLYISSAPSPRRSLMSDATEPYRRQRIVEINAQPGNREALEAQYGQVWTTEELSQSFEVLGFMAPLVVVRRKSD